MRYLLRYFRADIASGADSRTCLLPALLTLVYIFRGDIRLLRCAGCGVCGRSGDGHKKERPV